MVDAHSSMQSGKWQRTGTALNVGTGQGAPAVRVGREGGREEGRGGRGGRQMGAGVSALALHLQVVAGVPFQDGASAARAGLYRDSGAGSKEQ